MAQLSDGDNYAVIWGRINQSWDIEGIYCNGSMFHDDIYQEAITLAQALPTLLHSGLPIGLTRLVNDGVVKLNLNFVQFDMILIYYQLVGIADRNFIADDNMFIYTLLKEKASKLFLAAIELNLTCHDGTWEEHLQKLGENKNEQ